MAVKWGKGVKFTHLFLGILNSSLIRHKSYFTVAAVLVLDPLRLLAPPDGVCPLLGEKLFPEPLFAPPFPVEPLFPLDVVDEEDQCE